MKFSKSSLLISAILILKTLSTYAQVDSYIGAYTGENKNGYLQPVATVLTSAINTGQVTHARIDSNFHVYFHIIGTASFISSDNLKYFDATTPDRFTPKKTARTSTLLGPRRTTNVSGVNGTVYTFPAGLGVEFLSLAVPQLALSVAKTELTIRFFAYDTKDDLGKINLWGAGLRHDIGQYFRMDTDWNLSIGGMYQNIKTGSYLDLSTYNGSLTFGHQKRQFHYFVQAGYQSGMLKGEYKHYNGENFEKVSIDLDSDSPLFFGLGAGLSLGALQIQLQASGYEPIIGSFTLGIKF